MELWIVLFFLVIAISFLLAYQSMRDFQETATHSPLEYAVYLIRTPNAVTPEVLDSIHSLLVAQHLLISFETLFKGNKRAHVIFGAKPVLERFKESLGLLELEDYVLQVNPSSSTAWEMGIKESLHTNPDIPTLFEELPHLEGHEQFWWQISLQAQNTAPKMNPLMGFTSTVFGFPIKEDKKRLVANSTKKTFQSQIRCVLVTPDMVRRRVVGQMLEKLNEDVLIKTPKPLTAAQIFESYKLRSIPSVRVSPVFLTTQEVVVLAGLKD